MMMFDRLSQQQHEVERVTTASPPIRLGFFTRLLDRAGAAERYRLAIAQIVHAERCGFDSAWIAQHHFHEDEGGLPAPFVFLAQAAAQTTRIRLGTGIITLPLSCRYEWRRTPRCST
jgi:alkanesulfonate monooxygenase SsuD/methylene tetrahydromethanopterin reductase-like flavin-dependent oxidoreductase (luciferase family)